MSINSLYTERPPAEGKHIQYRDQVRQSMTWRSMSQVYAEYAEQGTMSSKGSFNTYLVDQIPSFGAYMSESFPTTDLTNGSIADVFSFFHQFILDTET